jgi:hypothetical protein
MPHDDPRRPLKIRRLREEKSRIVTFQAREPLLDDPEFEQWKKAVHALLVELFGANEFVLRFKQLRCRPISYHMGGGREWYADPKAEWERGLKNADKVLCEAVEEAEMVVPVAQTSSASTPRAPHVTINVHNENIFSPNVHVTVSELLDRLGELDLSVDEQALAREQLQELAAETQGQKRWPIIARVLEAMKSLGKSVYKDVAVPFLVDFLKREAGLPPHA